MLTGMWMQCGSSSHAGWLEWTVCTAKAGTREAPVPWSVLQLSIWQGELWEVGGGWCCVWCVCVCVCVVWVGVCGSVVIACSILQAIKNWRCGRPGNEAMYCTCGGCKGGWVGGWHGSNSWSGRNQYCGTQRCEFVRPLHRELPSAGLFT